MKKSNPTTSGSHVDVEKKNAPSHITNHEMSVEEYGKILDKIVADYERDLREINRS